MKTTTEDVHHGYDPREATIESIQRDLFSGKATCRQIVTSFVARIQALDSQVKAIVALNPKALDVADTLDAALATGKHRGSLFGVPVILKDNFDEVNMSTTGGSRALADLRPGEDAATVKALKDAGAIILGKANLHEMALEGLTVSSFGGQTVNPYDHSRTPGGSSGGSGVAVATSFCVFSTGTDTMNSLRSPASANGLFSIRPSWGLVSTVGLLPNAYTQDVAGPIARCMSDLAAALTVMASAGPDAKGVDYGKDLTIGSLKGLRLGLVETLMDRQGADETAPVNAAISMIVAHLRQLGSEVISVNEQVYDTLKIATDCDTQQYEYRRELNTYLKKPTHTGTFPSTFEELYSHDDIIVIPTRRDLIRKANTSSTGDAEYQVVKSNIKNLKHHLEATFDNLRLDALIYPEQSNLVVKIGSPSQRGRNGILAAVTGWPVVALPIGFSPSTEEAPLGVPIGMELLGKPGSEQQLLQIAYQIEQQIPSRKQPRFGSEFVKSRQLAEMPNVGSRSTSDVRGAYPVGSCLK